MTRNGTDDLGWDATLPLGLSESDQLLLKMAIAALKADGGTLPLIAGDGTAHVIGRADHLSVTRDGDLRLTGTLHRPAGDAEARARGLAVMRGQWRRIDVEAMPRVRNGTVADLDLILARVSREGSPRSGSLMVEPAPVKIPDVEERRELAADLLEIRRRASELTPMGELRREVRELAKTSAA